MDLLSEEAVHGLTIKLKSSNRNIALYHLGQLYGILESYGIGYPIPKSPRGIRVRTLSLPRYSSFLT